MALGFGEGERLGGTSRLTTGDFAQQGHVAPDEVLGLGAADGTTEDGKASSTDAVDSVCALCGRNRSMSRVVRLTSLIGPSAGITCRSARVHGSRSCSPPCPPCRARA